MADGVNTRSSHIMEEGLEILTDINKDSLCISPAHAFKQERNAMLSQIRAFVKNAVICQNRDS